MIAHISLNILQNTRKIDYELSVFRMSEIYGECKSQRHTSSYKIQCLPILTMLWHQRNYSHGTVISINNTYCKNP